MSRPSVEEVISDLLDDARRELDRAEAERAKGGGLSEGRRETARYHVARAQAFATMAVALRDEGRMR